MGMINEFDTPKITATNKIAAQALTDMITARAGCIHDTSFIAPAIEDVLNACAQSIAEAAYETNREVIAREYTMSMMMAALNKIVARGKHDLDWIITDAALELVHDKTIRCNIKAMFKGVDAKEVEA